MKYKFPKGILVITGKNCASCKVLKRNLKKLEIPFTEWDIKDHPEMTSVTGGLPYVMRDGTTLFVGSPDKMLLLKMITEEPW